MLAPLLTLLTTRPSSASVTRLVVRVGDGDPASFRELHRRLGASVLALAHDTVVDGDRAAAVANGVWVEVWWMSRHHREDDVLTWLRTIVTRRSGELNRQTAARTAPLACDPRFYDEHVGSMLHLLLDGAAPVAATPAQRHSGPAGHHLTGNRSIA
jgi:DNA-directed RNA polymerase specialized sigma24 family protein